MDVPEIGRIRSYTFSDVVLETRMDKTLSIETIFRFYHLSRSTLDLELIKSISTAPNS
jgi:hypothetical protein